MDRRVWTLTCSLGVVTLLALAAWVTPTHSSGMAKVNPKLTVESCLVQGTSTFRLRATNGDVAGEWRLKLHLGEEVIDFGYLEANEEVGGFDPTTAITTAVEGTWKKQFFEDGQWVNRNGAHVLSVEEHTLNGWFCPPYELGDLVWYDTDQDGIQDAGEPGVEAIEVQLYATPTCTGTLLYSYTTDITGTYVFTGLDPGDYCMEFHSIPISREITLQNQGADESVDSDAAQDTARIESIILGADDYEEDMGLYVDGSIGDRVWCDLDSNDAYDPGEGMANITVWLYDDPNCDDQEDVLLATTQTFGDGEYFFTDLNTGPPGPTTQLCYVVAVESSDEDLGACNSPLTELDYGFLLNADGPHASTADFGFKEPSEPEGYRNFCPLVIKQG
ncbi:MAG: SdrD B-like domain-containing protein [Anaerolineae bacterium]